MPKFKVILLAEARGELRQIARVHKTKVGPQSAKRITDRLLAALRHLEDFQFYFAAPGGFRALFLWVSGVAAGSAGRVTSMALAF